MNLSDYKSIALRRDGRVLHAMFNRPETMNAIDDELHDEARCDTWKLYRIERAPRTLLQRSLLCRLEQGEPWENT
jgi:hypothetical protein